MGLLKSAWILLLFLVVFSSFCFRFHYCYGSELSVKFLKTPPTVSRFHSAKFSFQAFENGNTTCSSCKFQCKLDDQFSVDCHRRRVFYSKLLDGNHTLEVCANRMPRFGCNVYNWTVDTVSPTASVTASMPFTSAQNVSVNITFTEPCVGGGGFRCSSVNACDVTSCLRCWPSYTIFIHRSWKLSQILTSCGIITWCSIWKDCVGDGQECLFWHSR